MFGSPGDWDFHHAEDLRHLSGERSKEIMQKGGILDVKVKIKIKVKEEV